MKPPFGTMNATLAKTIAQNSPKYRRIVEPFADGGTYALHVGHKPPKEHVINIVDEALFGAMTFAQQASSADRARLKRLDWIASQETFDAVMRITATEGADAFYRFLYVKKFGMAMEPDAPPEFDVLKTGQDISALLYTLPMMRAMLKSATITNDEPLSLLGSGGSDTLFILLPKKPEDAEAVQSRLSGISGNVFAAWKVLDAEGVIDAAKRFSDKVVSPLAVASIMMATMATVTNYESKLVPIDPATGAMADMDTRGKPQVVIRSPERRSLRPVEKRRALAKSYLRVFHQAAARIIKREEADVMRQAVKLLRRRSETEFFAWLESFYAQHGEFVRENIDPVYDAYLEMVAVEAAGEVGTEPEVTPALRDFADRYIDAYIARHVGSSLGQLRNVVREAIAAGDDPVQSLQARFDAWRETRPQRIAEAEAIRFSGAVTKTVFAAAGVLRIRWVTFDKECPFCSEMDGRAVAIADFFAHEGEELNPPGARAPLAIKNDIGHPPLHGGCTCGITPG